MADKPVGTDLVTKLNAANMQPLWDMVWDGLGETPVPTSVRAHIQAQPVAPSDGTNYVARNGGWEAQNPQDIAGALAGKLDIAGGTIQGTLRVNGAVTLDSPATVPGGATGAQVPQVQEVVKKSGDTMTGQLTVPGGATGAQVPQVQEVVKKSGDTMTGQLDLPTPTGDSNPTLLSQFAALLATSGYQKLPSGLIIQWGQAQSSTPVIFQIPFPSAVLRVVCSSQHAFTSNVAAISVASAITTTGFTLLSKVQPLSGGAWTDNTGVIATWIAIGY